MKTFILSSHESKDMAKHFIDRISADGKMQVDIKKVQSVRSIAQNRLYWMWVGIMAEETGHTRKEIHEHLKDEFLQPVITKVFGKTIQSLPSTKDLKVGEFSTYLEKVEFHAGEFDIRLPKPEDLWNVAMRRRH